MSRLHNRRGQSSPSKYQSDQSRTTRQNPSKVPAPSGPGLHLPADEYLQQILGGEQSPSRIERSRHQANPERSEGHTKDGEL